MGSVEGNEKRSHHSGENKTRLVFGEVTKGCNLRCIHCRATATEISSPSDLATRNALAIVDQIAAAANPILVLSGGEPLYRFDIFQQTRASAASRSVSRALMPPLRIASAAFRERLTPL